MLGCGEAADALDRMATDMIELKNVLLMVLTVLLLVGLRMASAASEGDH